MRNRSWRRHSVAIEVSIRKRESSQHRGSKAFVEWSILLMRHTTTAPETRQLAFAPVSRRCSTVETRGSVHLAPAPCSVVTRTCSPSAFVSGVCQGRSMTSQLSLCAPHVCANAKF